MASVHQRSFSAAEVRDRSFPRRLEFRAGHAVGVEVSRK